MSSSLTERGDVLGRGEAMMGRTDEDVPALAELAQQPDVGRDADKTRSDANGNAGNNDHENDDDNDADVKTIRGSKETGTIGNLNGGADDSADGSRDKSADSVENGAEDDRSVAASDADRPQPPATSERQANGSGALNRYRQLLREQQQEDSASEDGSALGLPRRPGSPGGESILSIPESAASNRHSMVSSFGGSSIFPSSGSLSRFGLRGASPSFRPFDQRFQSRIASPSGSGLLSPSSRPMSPAVHAIGATHHRSPSLNSQLLHNDAYTSAIVGGSTDSPSPPWEVVRWTRLMKLSNQAFSESAKRNFGSPTCMAISASLVLGTTKGILLVFDFNQNLKMIVGPGTKGKLNRLHEFMNRIIREKYMLFPTEARPAADIPASAVEAGAITSVAISADNTTIAAGHTDGSIFTWEMSRISRPFLHIPPINPAQVQSPQRSVDGHLPGFAVTNLGFLGKRRTALVSADDRGMAFAHLATRGTGALGRTVKTNRILGRYPGSKAAVSGKPLRPSTVLAFAPLPIGNVDSATDTMGLTAMLTPYLLVIVSTTPVANTQHKTPRPKEVAPHSAMSGCLAWFPAVKLKLPDPRTGDTISKAKLVYCWSNILTVLDVDEIPSEDRDKPPSLNCKARSRWRSEEAIVAVQWLTRSVLAVLTISQRLIVIEDHSMRVTEAFDMINRFIYHADLFSRQLHNVVETLDENDTSLHGVVADAFYMSFKSYKGRLFLLGFNDMAIGALSNWADRLIALMEHGDYVGAIQLATSFYTGDADKLTIGLPEDTATRHAMVQERLMEIMAASLKYAFGLRQKNRVAADDHHLLDLAQTCFVACESVSDTDFLFDTMYEWFEETGTEGIFLETLEPYILDRVVSAVPPTVVKALIRHYVGRGMESRLEEMICHMDTATLDLDQVTSLCKQHGLYDALVYVWNQAMSDFITPLVDLLSLLVPYMPSGEYEAPENATAEQDMHDTNALKMFPYLSYVLTGRVYPTGEIMDEATQQKAKSEIFWFLFSGKSITWPRGGRAGKRFLTRPGQTQEPSFPYLRMILKFHAPSFLSALNEAFEDSFLNDSPDKQLVNGNTARDLPEEQVFGLTVDRQYIVSILTEIMNPADFASEDTIYLDMFIARNLPKYPQYLLLPESTLTKVLTGLCHYPGPDLEEDAQLSAEYLLSVYHPPDMSDLLPLFQSAGFYRILKRTYHSEKQYAKLLHTYFEDPDDKQAVFECIAECLRPQSSNKSGTDSGLSSNALRRQIQEVLNVIQEHSFELVTLDAAEAARKLDEFAPKLHRHVLQSVNERHDLQYSYLKTILEDAEADHAAISAGPSDGEFQAGSERRRRKQKPSSDQTPPPKERRELIEQYVRLMCEFDPSHVSDYVGHVQSANLRLEELLPTMENTGVIDAAVVLMAQDGQIQEAMDRLIEHLHTLEAAVLGVLTASPSSQDDNSNGGDIAGELPKDDLSDSGASNVTIIQRNAAEDLMRALQKYTHVGIWLCQRQADATARKPSRHLTKQSQTKKDPSVSGRSSADEELTPDEKLWLDLIDTTVIITRNLASHIDGVPENKKANEMAATECSGASAATDVAAESGTTQAEAEKLVGLLRSLVQHTFTALLTTTSSGPLPSSPSPSSSASRSILQRDNTIVAAGSNLSFLRILKAFLARAAASSPNLADLRGVLASIFSAYAYEETILRLSNRLLERSLFVNVKQAVVLRQRGWRARGSTCEACGRRVWGPGVMQGYGRGEGTSIYEAWEAKQAAEAERRAEKKRATLLTIRGDLDRGKGKDGDGGGLGAAAGKGKGSLAPASPLLGLSGGGVAGSRAASPLPGNGQTAPRDGDGGALGIVSVGADTGTAVVPRDGPQARSAVSLGPLVLFACRHIYHQACLDALEDVGVVQNMEGGSSSRVARITGTDDGSGIVHKRWQHGERDRDYVCPLDG